MASAGDDDVAAIGGIKVKPDEAPVGDGAGENVAPKAGGEEKSVIEPKVEEEASKSVEPEAVKAPGLVDRAKEEVEAVAEALLEKLDLNAPEKNVAAPKPAEGGAAQENEDEKKEKGKEEQQASVFKRLLKKLGWK